MVRVRVRVRVRIRVRVRVRARIRVGVRVGLGFGLAVRADRVVCAMHEQEAKVAAPARQERAALCLEPEEAVGGAVADPRLVVDERVLLLGLGLELGSEGQG